MTQFNAVNRGVYISDNLPFLRALNDECIDLICIDPPFAKNETFTGDKLKPSLTDEEQDTERRLMARWGITDVQSAANAGIAWPHVPRGGGYLDIWSWENDIHEEWLQTLDQDWQGIAKLIDATRYVHGDSIAAYLCYMAIRIIEIHRVLKPTGSLYLHCDHTANGYLRQLLDGIFGKQNFRNEIIWCYGKMSNTGKNFPRNHDTIFRYTKTENYTFTIVKGGESEYRERYRRYLTKNKVLYGSVKNSNDKLVLRRIAKVRNQLKRDLVDHDVLFNFDIEFKVQSDVLYIPIIRGNAEERTGYPTQKPVALAERIIVASTNPGDIVLDCFAGCAYAAIAAEKLERRWVACDLNPRAWTVFKRQFNKPSLALLTCSEDTLGQQVMDMMPVVTVYGPRELPTRMSPLPEDRPANLTLPEPKFKVPASIIPAREMLECLLKLSGYQAWCCGFANRKPDGTIIKTTRNFHLDHMDPQSKEGTSHQITNRAPMCPHHNTRKNNRRVHLAEYRKEIKASGELMVESLDDLIDLNFAAQRALEIYAQSYQSRQPLFYG